MSRSVEFPRPYGPVTISMADGEGHAKEVKVFLPTYIMKPADDERCARRL